MQTNHMFAIFALRLKDAIFVTDPFCVFGLSRVPIWRIGTVILCYLMSEVLFSSM